MLSGRNYLFIKFFSIIKRYLETYKKYSDFLTSKADQDVTAFLKETHELFEFEEQIKKYTLIRDGVTLTRLTAQLEFYCLECNDLHENLRERIQRLRTRLVQFCTDQNREMNKGYSYFYFVFPYVLPTDISEFIENQPTLQTKNDILGTSKCLE